MLIVRTARHKHSYKNCKFGLTSIEKMTIKSVSEQLDTLINISILTGTSKLDKLIKGMCNIYMDRTRLLEQGSKASKNVGNTTREQRFENGIMTIANEYYALLHLGVMHYVLDKIKRFHIII